MKKIKDKRFRKYQFNDEQDALDSIATLDVEGEAPVYSGLVMLGFLVNKEGEYDEEGNETKAPTYDSKYSVDVFWKGLEPEGWKSKKIKLDGAKNRHTFLGLEYEDEIV